MGDLKEIKQWRKKAIPHIFALEPRMLFDGVTVVDNQINDSQNIELTTQDITHLDSIDLSTESSSALISSQLNVIGDINLSIPALIDWQNALISSQKSFTDFVNSDQYLLRMTDIFKSQDLDLNTFNQRIDALKQSILSIGLNAEIQLRSSTELKGYLAAYHFNEETGKDHIYLNKDWIEFGVGEKMIHRAILEEIGHAIDHRLNGAIDAIGDEGEYFSRVITNDVLTLDEINRIKNENDHDQIFIDGKYIDVEFASLNFTRGYIGTTSNYAAIGTTYTAETNSIYIKTAIATGSFTFTSANPADTTFSGNNVAGQLVYYLDGNQFTINGVFSRPDKNGSTPIGLYFVETTVLGASGKGLVSAGGTSTGRGYFFVIPGNESSYNTTNGLNVSTSSDSVSSALNTADTAQASNQPPVISSNGSGTTASISIAENTTTVTTVTATDANAGDSKTFIIYGGADRAKFTINSSTGVLTFISAPDAENPTDTNKDNVYEVGVMVYDSKGAFDTQDISVTVTNVDDNPPIISSDGGGNTATISIPKNTVTVTTVVANDGDIGDVLVYSLSGTNASLFKIGSTSGVLEFKTAPTTSGTYYVTVTATDVVSKTDTQDLTINVLDVDAVTPTLVITSSDSNLSLGEVCTIYFNFSEQVQNFTLSDITYAGGTLTNFYQDPADPRIYQATFTKSASAVTPSFSVATNSYQDLAGNNGSAASLTVAYDITAPTVTVNIEGTDIAFKQTKQVTFTFSEDPGTSFSLEDISVTNGTISNLLKDASDSKIWTATLQATNAASGPTVSVINQSYSDSAGNLGSSGTDSATLAAPSIDLANTATSDTGYSSSDNITTNRKPVIEGKAPANSSVTITVEGSNGATYTYNSVSVNSSGYWSIDLATRTASSISGGTALTSDGNLAEGYVGLLITVSADVTASSNFLIDLTAPVRPTVVSQTNISDRTPTITGTATVNSDEFLTVTVNGITYTAGDGNLSITGTNWTLTIPPENELPSTNTTYAVTATVTDAAGNATSDNTTGELVMNFGSLVAPVVDLDPTNSGTLNNSATFTEGDTTHSFFTKSGTNISDSDSTNLAYLKISITSSSTQARDYLVLDSTYIPIDVTGASGTVFYNSTYFSYLVSDSGGSRFITFTSRNSTNSTDLVASKASYETLIDAIAFTNEGSSFTNGSTRIFSVIANDGTLDSAVSTFTVTMASLNRSPVNTVPTAQTVNEDTSLAISGISVTDSDGNLSTTQLSVLQGTLTVSLTGGATISSGSNGTSTLTLSGTQIQINAALATLSYQGNSNYNGADTLTVLSTDSNGATDTDTVAITVSAVNDAPVNTVPSAQTVTEDTAKAITGVSVADVDGNSLTTTVSVSQGTLSVTTGGGATITNNGTGTVTIAGTAAQINAALNGLTYTNTADYNGSDTLTVTTTDGTLTDTDTVSLTINAVTDIANDTASTNEDTAVTTNVLTNDTFENAGRTITSVTQGTNGTVAIVNASTGTVSYTPNANWNGTDTYTYTVTSGGVTETATVTVTVSAVNDAPVNTVPSAQTVTEDTAKAITGVSVADVDGNSLTTTVSVSQGTLSVTTGGGATITNNGTGTVTIAGTAAQINAALNGLTYTNTADYNGSDTLTVTTTDGTLTDTDTVSLTINAVTDIANDTASTNEDTAVTTNVLTNDTFENAGRTITSVTQGTNGTVAIVNASTGTVSYTPNANWNGTDTYTYTVTSGGVTETATVTVTVSAVNDAPVNTVPSAQTVTEDTAKAITGVSVADVDGNSLTTTVSVSQGTLSVTTGGGATITNNGTGTVTIAGTAAQINAALNGLTYTNTADYNGSDTLTVTTTDGTLTDTDTVSLTINAVTDIANDTASTNEDTAVTTNVLTNDTFENAGRTITSVTQGTNGTVAIVNASTGTVSYTPNANWNGTDTYTYTVTSGGVTETATVTVTVSAVNDAPVNTVPSAQTVTEDTAKAITGVSVADVDGNSLTTTVSVSQGTLSVTTGGGATITNNGTGTVTIAGTAAQINAALNGLTYTNTADYNGSDTLTVTTTDGTLTDTDTVSLTINAVTDIANDTASTNEDTAVTTNVLTNDTFENAGRTITSVTQGTNGTVAIVNASTGTVSYTPNANWNGTDTYTYTVTSGGVTETATVTVTVSAVNDAPVNTVPSAQTVTEDTAKAITGVSVADVDGNSLTTTVSVSQGTLSVTTGGGATITNNGTGTVTIAGTAAQINAALNGLTYTNTADYNGSDTLTVTTTDGTLTDTDTVSLTINAVTDIANDTASTNEDTAVTTNVLTNDTFENAGRTITSVTQGTNGTVAIVNASTGTVSYTPNANWNGTDTYTYTVTSGGVTETATVTVTVSAVNDAPVNTVPSAQTVTEDTAKAITGVSVNDINGNLSTTQLSVLQGTLTVSLTGGATISSGSNGTSTLTLSGTQIQINAALATLSYQGNSNYNGADTLTVLSTDSNGATDTDTVAITVSAVNDASVLVNDTKNINQNNNATGNILTNDSDVDDSLTVASFIVEGNTYTFGQTATIVGKGTITIASNGDYTFIPVADWNGTIPTITYTTNTGSTASLDITVSEANDDENLKFLSRARVLPPVIKPNNNKDLVIDNEEEIDSNKFYEDEEEISIAIKPHFSKASLVNTQLKNSSKPLKIASPEAPTKADKANAQKQNSNDQKNDTGLKNTLTPPDALADNNGHVAYKLPEGTFTNGHGAISLHATQKDGSPLPDWIKFDASTGKIIADVPKGLSAPIEIKVQATDSKGDKAETLFKLKPQNDKVSFIGKKSLSAQLKNAFELVA